MIAKSSAYGLDIVYLRLIHSHLTHRHQRLRVFSSYRSLSEIISGVPQGSILGPILFNIYLAHLFLLMKDENRANYADDNTPYALENDIDAVLNKLERDSVILLQWFAQNVMKANSDKSHLLLSNSNLNLSANISGNQISNENNVILRGITFDNSLSFDDHVSSLCKKATQKLHALSRVSFYMSYKQRRILMKAFIQSQFGYCPLIWMFHSHRLNNRINRIHERSLRIVYRDAHSSFDELLRKNNTFTVHERNIQFLAIELYKVKNAIAPESMNDIFPLKDDIVYCSCIQWH